jgi:hypothetical protein
VVLIHICVSCSLSALRRVSIIPVIGDFLGLGLLITTAFMSRVLANSYHCSGWLAGLPISGEDDDGSLLKRDSESPETESSETMSSDEPPQCMALRGVLGSSFCICVLFVITCILMVMALYIQYKEDSPNNGLSENVLTQNGRSSCGDVEGAIVIANEPKGGRMSSESGASLCEDGRLPTPPQKAAVSLPSAF